ncbi:hypothetical protein GPALN_013166 [Globodera pallida]|nr:hypothetical protein GPALN_013166 [Globodera pallida]
MSGIDMHNLTLGPFVGGTVTRSDSFIELRKCRKIRRRSFVDCQNLVSIQASQNALAIENRIQLARNELVNLRNALVTGLPPRLLSYTTYESTMPKTGIRTLLSHEFSFDQKPNQALQNLRQSKGMGVVSHSTVKQRWANSVMAMRTSKLNRKYREAVERFKG